MDMAKLVYLGVLAMALQFFSADRADASASNSHIASVTLSAKRFRSTSMLAPVSTVATRYRAKIEFAPPNRLSCTFSLGSDQWPTGGSTYSGVVTWQGPNLLDRGAWTIDGVSRNRNFEREGPNLGNGKLKVDIHDLYLALGAIATLVNREKVVGFNHGRYSSVSAAKLMTSLDGRLALKTLASHCRRLPAL